MLLAIEDSTLLSHLTEKSLPNIVELPLETFIVFFQNNEQGRIGIGVITPGNRIRAHADIVCASSPWITLNSNGNYMFSTSLGVKGRIETLGVSNFKQKIFL